MMAVKSTRRGLPMWPFVDLALVGRVRPEVLENDNDDDDTRSRGRLMISSGTSV